MKHFLIGTAIAALTAGLTQAETWKMSADAPDGNYLTKNIRAFADDVARLSDGALEIDVVSNSVLLKRPELKRGVQRGIVPIGEVLISALGNEDAVYSADAVPLLATTFDEARALPDLSNFVFWTLVGNVGYAGFTAVYALNETAPYLEDACAWAAAAYDAGDLDLLVLAGHWSQLGDGAAADMPTPHVHHLSKTGAFGDGCSRLAALGRLKFVEGHHHCNMPAPNHDRDGWMVAAQGMSGCGTYDIVTLDTRHDRAVLLNFRIADVHGADNYDDLLLCFRLHGARNCADRADVWLNQSLARPTAGAPGPGTTD